MKFGEKLRQCRKECHLTQSDLAEKSGIGLRTITNYELGKTYPKNRETYQTLANILGVEVSYLKNEEDDFIITASKQYGSRGMKQAQRLVNEMGGLFAGGSLSDDDMDGVMRAMQELYWNAKERNKKYTPKKYLRTEDSDI